MKESVSIDPQEVVKPEQQSAVNDVVSTKGELAAGLKAVPEASALAKTVPEASDKSALSKMVPEGSDESAILKAVPEVVEAIGQISNYFGSSAGRLDEVVVGQEKTTIADMEVVEKACPKGTNEGPSGRTAIGQLSHETIGRLAGEIAERLGKTIGDRKEQGSNTNVPSYAPEKCVTVSSKGSCEEDDLKTGVREVKGDGRPQVDKLQEMLVTEREIFGGRMSGGEEEMVDGEGEVDDPMEVVEGLHDQVLCDPVVVDDEVCGVDKHDSVEAGSLSDFDGESDFDSGADSDGDTGGGGDKGKEGMEGGGDSKVEMDDEYEVGGEGDNITEEAHGGGDTLSLSQEKMKENFMKITSMNVDISLRGEPQLYRVC